MWKRVLIWLAGILGLLLLTILVTMGPLLRDFLSIEVVNENEGIYILTDYGGNSGLIVGDSLAIVIDTKMARGSKKLKSFAQSKVGDREIIIINTHFHGDHVMGNEKFEGAKIFAGDYGRNLWLSESKEETLPNNWVSKDMSIELGSGESVEIFAVGQNHTQKDLLIYSPKHKVLFTGDIYTHLSHPVMKEGSDPNIKRWEETLRTFADKDLEIDRVVPGHGDLARKKDLLLMADYFSDIQNLDKKTLKDKYGKWESLPFLAGLNKSLKYLASKEEQP